MFADARLINFIANTLALLAVAAFVGAALVWVAQRPYFSLSRIYIEPLNTEHLQYVSPATVRETIAGEFRGNFFFAQLGEVRALFEKSPWVRKAQVQRVWPDALRVRFEEHHPLAIWNDDKMLNTWGEPFSANQGELPDDMNLPRLSGPEASERLVVQRYAELVRWFAPLHVRVQEVHLSPRYAWEVTLAGGLQLSLGRDPAADEADLHGRSGALPFAERVERFVEVWPALMERLDGRALRTVDLRYPNGFAVTLASVNDDVAK